MTQAALKIAGSFASAARFASTRGRVHHCGDRARRQLGALFGQDPGRKGMKGRYLAQQEQRRGVRMGPSVPFIPSIPGTRGQQGGDDDTKHRRRGIFAAASGANGVDEGDRCGLPRAGTSSSFLRVLHQDSGSLFLGSPGMKGMKGGGISLDRVEGFASQWGLPSLPSQERLE